MARALRCLYGRWVTRLPWHGSATAAGCSKPPRANSWRSPGIIAAVCACPGIRPRRQACSRPPLARWLRGSSSPGLMGSGCSTARGTAAGPGSPPRANRRRPDAPHPWRPRHGGQHRWRATLGKSHLGAEDAIYGATWDRHTVRRMDLVAGSVDAGATTITVGRGPERIERLDGLLYGESLSRHRWRRCLAVPVDHRYVSHA